MARGLILLLVALVLATPVWAEPGVQLPVRVYRDLDGLPQNTVHAVTLDRQGLMWVGTQDGAAVWDGRRWLAVAMPDRASSNFVRTILASADGSLWFGTQAGGLHRRVDGRWERHEPRADGLPSPRINALAELANGTLVVGTHEGGIALFEAGRWRRLGVAEGLPSDRVWSLAPARHDGVDGVWAACEGGVVFVDPARGQASRDPDFPRGHANSVVAFSGPTGDEVWVGTYGEGVFRLAAGRWSQISREQGLGSAFVTSLAVESPDELGRVWIGTDGGGIASWDSARGVFAITSAQGLPSDAVYSLLVTTEAEGAAAIWVGTRNGGLARVRELGWRALAPVAEAPTIAVTALAEEQLADGSSAHWFGTDGAGVVRRSATGTERWTSASGLPNDFVQALLVHGTGSSRQVWVGLRNGGLVRLGPEGAVLEVIRAADGGIPHDLIQGLLMRDTTGGPELWVGTREGLAVRRGDRWERIPGLPPVSITGFAQSHDGSLWVGSSMGIIHVVGERFSIIDQRNGLRNPGILHLLETVEREGERLLWVGTDGGGLALFELGGAEPTLVANFGQESDPPLPNDVVFGLAQADGGSLFVLSNRGVAELSLSDPAVRYGPSVHVHIFGPEDGLPALAGNRAAILIDRNKHLWVGTVEGAGSLDLAEARSEDRAAKRLVLRHVTVDSEPRTVEPGSVVELGPDDRSLLVDFALLSFFREHDTRYRSQVLGLEERAGSWTPTGLRELTGLPPGDYTLQIQGRDYEGNISAPLEIPILVRASLWGTLWTHVVPPLAVALAALAVVLLQRRSSRRQAERFAVREASAAEQAQRTRRLLAACGLADPLTGVTNDEVLSLLCRRPAVAGGALLVLGLKDAATPLADAARFEARAVEMLMAAAPHGEAGRFDTGVVWLWLPAVDTSTARRVLDTARHELAELGIVGALAVAEPGDVSGLPARAAQAFVGARRTGSVTTG